jgi:hypothetical protein
MYETLGEMAENGRKWQKMADIWQRSKRNEKIASKMWKKAGEEKETRGLGQ